MADPLPAVSFYSDLARIINSGQSRSILVCGNIYDLFPVSGKDDAGDYLPLTDFLVEKSKGSGKILIVYELNGPIRIIDPAHRAEVAKGWVAWKLASEVFDETDQAMASKQQKVQREVLENQFSAFLQGGVEKPAVALEFLRQLSICSRTNAPSGREYLGDLLIIIEAADYLLPAGDGGVSQLSISDRHRVGIVQDWFSDPGFLSGDDTVILLAESRSLVHPRASRLPSVLEVQVPSPDEAARRKYIDWFLNRSSPELGPQMPKPQLWAGPEELARLTAGLSIHALRQMLIGAAFSGSPLSINDVVAKVEEFIQAQLGDDVIEFKKPSHTMADVVGFSQLKKFIENEMIPRFRTSGPEALPGAAVAGPIGGGKTFIFEAAAAALDLPVLVLKNIRSQWFGQTDVIFERLRRVLEALVKAVIFVDEADTQFGGVGADAHETERRLTGKIQQMMSDPALRGRIIWLLMTARIHLLSPDIRRPGRVGDLIIPVLDPTGEDRREFLDWAIKPAGVGKLDDPAYERLDKLTAEYSAAAFASLRSLLKAKAISAKATGGKLTLEEIEKLVHDQIPPAIEETRRYQTLQALVNCTRRSLLPDPSISPETRAGWQQEIRRLEAQGIR